MGNSSRKQRLLCWSDSPLAGTGFATVSKHVLSSLYSTGKYDIHQLGINAQGDFVDTNQVPWQIQPARLLDPNDPHGIKMFERTLARVEYDIVWILNDIFVTHEARDIVTRIKTKYSQSGKRPPLFVYYYPVDCKVNPWDTGMLDVADVLVCYTDHGRLETLKTIPSVESKLKQISHGVDTNVFRPAPRILCAKWKSEFYGIGPETYLVLNLNRNSTRKQIPYTILAFKEFKKQVPNSVLYLHMVPQDQGGDLNKIVADSGLTREDVLFPSNFSLTNPLPVEYLNKVYNSADMFLTTHLGEGWGLSITEAMACGVPVVSPNNTCMPEQLGINEERGYMYPCRDSIYVDSSGYRPKGYLEDIVSKMIEVYNAGPKESNPKVRAALEYAKSVDWGKIGVEWIKLFDDLTVLKNKAKRIQIESI